MPFLCAANQGQGAYLELSLAEKIQPFGVLCPKIVLPYQQLTCNITVNFGGEMQMNMSYGNGTVLPVYNIPGENKILYNCLLVY
jgi:hypothetical protein